MKRGFLLGLLFLMGTYFLRAQYSPKYEFRGVWIATVVNIDWPSKPALTSFQQKGEYIKILDSLQKMNMNAVVVQVRPSADALYPSELEPWSEYLTGTQGVAPYPYYDPLKFMIDEAHKRNMEFHAWLNPYRAVFDVQRSKIASNHITRKKPEWFLTYGNKKYFNPGLPEVMDYVTGIVQDIISRYDVDAIHMDDYFYPYKIPGKEFPDHAAYLKYGKGMSKDEWRRSNCDSIIRKIHDVIVDYRPLIKFGISPFGVWRNNSKDPQGSFTQAGVSNYDDLYADILLWLKEGWIDYVAPQLYWEIGHRLCDYNELLPWWGRHNYRKHLYIGHGIYRYFESPTAAWRRPDEIPNQIKYLRENRNVQGSIYFSVKDLLRNPMGWADSLKNNYYARPALVPPMPWIDTFKPQTPEIFNLTDGMEGYDRGFRLYGKASSKTENELLKSFVVYISDSYDAITEHPYKIVAVDPTKKFTVFIPEKDIPRNWKNCFIAITLVDRENNESDRSEIVGLIPTEKGWQIPK